MGHIVFTALLSLYTSICFGQVSKDSFYYKKIVEPGVRFIPVYGGKYKVFTQKVGSGKIKLVLLHGGPGGTHQIFENFPVHLNSNKISLYFYDQLGSYYSDQPQDSTIWNINRFVDEVEEVRKGLGLSSFYILGHSWGTQLAQLYAAKYPTHLKGVILSNPPVNISDTAKLNTAQREWATRFRTSIKNTPGLKDLPMATYDSVMKGIALADTIQFARLNRLAIQARDSFLRTTNYRLPGELPEPVRRSRSHSRNKNIPASFDHQLMSYDWVSPRANVKCPVLIIGGTQDRMFHQLYPDMKAEFSNAKVRIYMCRNSGHLSMWDDSENYFREVKRFLKEVENKCFDPEK